MLTSKTTTARFWSKVKVLKSKQCWEWQSSCSNGYGKFSIENYPHSAHVLAFKYFHGEYEKGLQVDHICMNRSCVNPEHLRLVTPRINLIENSNGMAAINIRKTHCKNGHEFNSENTAMKLNGDGKRARTCRACSLFKARDRYRRARNTLKKLGVES